MSSESQCIGDVNKLVGRLIGHTQRLCSRPVVCACDCLIYALFTSELCLSMLFDKYDGGEVGAAGKYLGGQLACAASLLGDMNANALGSRSRFMWGRLYFGSI